MTDLPTQGSVSVIEPAQIVKPTSPVELFKGTEYWVVASAPSGTSAWNLNIIRETGFAVNTGAGTPFHFIDGINPAVAILGTPVSAAVPEPATFGLMVLGVLGAGFAGRRRRN